MDTSYEAFLKRWDRHVEERRKEGPEGLLAHAAMADRCLSQGAVDAKPHGPALAAAGVG